MKKYFLFFIVIVFCARSNAQPIISPDPDAPVMTFDSITYDFGEIVQGTRVEKDFHFKNTGRTPLIITDARGSGSIVPSYSKEPIAPGKSGVIRALLYTDGKMGLQDKTLTIESNNRDGVIVLHMKGKVVPRPCPAMQFDSASYHFPKTLQGQTVYVEMHFVNNGNSPLIINTCMSACGCDVATAPKEPIPPGGSGVIHYSLNTVSRMGPQSKSVTITYNFDQVIVINISGEIIPEASPH